LLDVSTDTEDASRVVAYLDGPDARLFKALLEKLGSEDKVQSALILLGLLSKLEDAEGAVSSEKTETAKDLFLEYAGVTYEQFLNIIHNCSSIV
jgi:hypothetical protein